LLHRGVRRKPRRLRRVYNDALPFPDDEATGNGYNIRLRWMYRLFDKKILPRGYVSRVKSGTGNNRQQSQRDPSGKTVARDSPAGLPLAPLLGPWQPVRINKSAPVFFPVSLFNDGNLRREFNSIQRKASDSSAAPRAIASRRQSKVDSWWQCESWWVENWLAFWKRRETERLYIFTSDERLIIFYSWKIRRRRATVRAMHVDRDTIYGKRAEEKRSECIIRDKGAGVCFYSREKPDANL